MFLTWVRASFHLFFPHQNSPTAHIVLNVSLPHMLRKLSKRLSGTFVPLSVNYTKASGSFRKEGPLWENESLFPVQGGATCLLGPCPAHTGAKVYRDETLWRNNPPFPKDRIHTWLILQGNPFRKAIWKCISNTETVAEINLAFEMTPHLCTLDAMLAQLCPSAGTA